MSKLRKLRIVHCDHKEHDGEHDHKDRGESSPETHAQLDLKYRELHAAYNLLLKQTATALMKCLEERDAYTFGHSMRVMNYASLIAKGVNLGTSDLRNLELSAMFHDIGKIGVADCVLLKPDRLTPEERASIRAHPVKSAEIIELIDAYKDLVPGIRHHHERFDGKGYPKKLAGAEIPAHARIILVADTFDAMTTTRPYRHALPLEAAYAELERYSGTQFDPDFVKAFLREHQNFMRQTDGKKIIKVAFGQSQKKTHKKKAA